MSIIKKLLLVSVALSLSACSMFEGKNTFMTYQDLQDQVKSHDTELQDVKAKLGRVDQLEAEVAELKKSQGGASADQSLMTQAASDNNMTDGTPMAASNVAPAVTAAPMIDSQSNNMNSAQSKVAAAPMASKQPNTMNSKQPKVATTPVTPVAASAKYEEKDSSYGVQLAAYGNRNEAARGWKVLSEGAPDVYVNLVPHVNQKQVNGRTMYQLKVGPFLDRAYSVDFCNMLKQKGKDCLVSKYDGQPL